MALFDKSGGSYSDKLANDDGRANGGKNGVQKVQVGKTGLGDKAKDRGD